MIKFSIINRVCQILKSVSVFRKNCSSCYHEERVAYQREAPISD
jgi:hypothetical protein